MEQSKLIFKDEIERERLAVQNKLLSFYERPMLEQIGKEYTQLTVLDIGCNDGRKTVERFAEDAMVKVVGLEYNRDLVDEAKKKYGNKKFSFHQCDVEGHHFTERLREVMVKEGIDGFSMIYLSFLLMHLKKPEKLLTNLQEFLLPGGSLIVIEANDCASILRPDKEELFGQFLHILEEDIYSGNRKIGEDLSTLLKNCGYQNIRIWNEGIEADRDDLEKKKEIFQVFLSYLPEDVALLCQIYPEQEEYRRWQEWIQKNYEELRKLIMGKETSIIMGMQMISCTRKKVDAEG